MRMSSRISQASGELPAVDEHLIVGESGYEVDDGKLVRVPPSLEPHGDRHSKIAALLEAHVADDFNVAIDMLTRISENDDRAPDASVYPRARDPRTGGRQLEHLAFEVVSTETLGHAAAKAAQLATRGVRRLFAIDVERQRGFEWSHELGTWSLLDPAGSIEDPTLAVALPIEALVCAAKADDAMARALLVKRNPVLVAAVQASEARGEAEGRAKGKAEALARAILVVLERRGIPIGAESRARIGGERDVRTLERWHALAVTCVSAAELFE
jgi:Uma2 family endonuclease